MAASLFWAPELWIQIDKLAEQAKPRQAAIAYVTDDSRLKFEENDILVCDASPDAIRSGHTDAAILARAVGRGAEVYSFQGLHAKVIVFGDVAVIGSANLSMSSRGLMEAGIVTGDPGLVADSIAFISELVADTRRCVRIEPDKLAQLLAIKVTRRIWKPKMLSAGRKRPRLSDVRSGWLSHAHPIARASSGKVEDQISQLEQSKPKGSEVQSYRVGRSSSIGIRACAGQRLILVWKSSRSNGKSVKVYPPIHIQKRVEDGSAVELLYYEHSRAERNALAWTKFTALLKDCGFTRVVTQSSVVCLTPEMMQRIQQEWPVTANKAGGRLR